MDKKERRIKKIGLEEGRQDSNYGLQQHRI
jgi:hypothetical protein